MLGSDPQKMHLDRRAKAGLASFPVASRAAGKEELVSEPTRHDQWAWFRFSVVGPLLASPPPRGGLREELARLSERAFKHPMTGEPVRFAASTIERWYYEARRSDDPVLVLRRKPRRDRGRQSAVSAKLGELLRSQHREHPTWSYQLHYDNLAPQVKDNPDLGRVPSYSSVRRYMVANGLERKRRRKGRETDGRRRPESRERRGFEAEYVNGLWHLDFHHGSRKILTTDGQWVKPYLLAIMDDHSRLGLPCPVVPARDSGKPRARSGAGVLQAGPAAGADE